MRKLAIISVFILLPTFVQAQGLQTIASFPHAQFPTVVMYLDIGKSISPMLFSQLRREFLQDLRFREIPMVSRVTAEITAVEWAIFAILAAYNDDFAAMNEPRRKQRGIVRSPVELHSGFNTFLTAPRGGVLNPSAQIRRNIFHVVDFSIGPRNFRAFVVLYPDNSDNMFIVEFL